MALMPKRVKFRKSQRGKRRGASGRGSSVNFGEYGLLALENKWLKNTQIEAARVAIMRHLRGAGKVWVTVFPDKSVSKKPAETRMGKGKGDPSHWVAFVKRGKILFEMGGIPLEIARECMRIAAHKVPFRTKFITRRVSH